MAAIRPHWQRDLLYYWFEKLGPSDWFGSSDVVDAELRQKFKDTLSALASKPANDFLTDIETARAAILLFDQVPRNIYRGSADAFAYDPLALEITKAVLSKGWDSDLPDDQRQFVAMPLMHSEVRADQDASLAYFGRHLPGNLSFAKSHHAMIARFGRFPHRNDMLGRETTEAEQPAINDGFSW